MRPGRRNSAGCSRVLDALRPDAAVDTVETTYHPALEPWADSDEADDLPPEAERDDYWCEASGGQASVIGEFERTDPVPVCAVDAGVVRLGETGHNAYVALRGSYVVEYRDGRTMPEAALYRSGPLRLPHGGTDQLQALHALGLSLGQADLYVRLDGAACPVEVRGGAAGNQAHFPDRVRNAVERQIQWAAAGAMIGRHPAPGRRALHLRHPTRFPGAARGAGARPRQLGGRGQQAVSTLNIGGRFRSGIWLDERAVPRLPPRH